MGIVNTLFLYTICWMLSYKIISTRYNSLKHKSIKNNIYTYSAEETPAKMTFLMIVIISTLFTLHNYYVTTALSYMSGDRVNYLQNFDYGRESPSLGLTAIMIVIQLFGGDFNALLYFTTFISLFITLLAYRYSKEATPLSLLLLMLSQYVQMTYDGIKQSYASAFATLMIVILLKERNMMRDIICVLLMTIAIVFHPAGYVLVPIYLFVRFLKKYKPRKILIILLLVSIVFVPLLRLFSDLFSSIVPMMSEKINEYFGEEYSSNHSAVMSIFKGVPFYIISYYGIHYRYSLVSKIENYDGFCFIAILCSFMFLMNIYDLWMSRFTYFFQFVTYIFWGILLIQNPRLKKQSVLIILLTGILNYRLFILSF